MPIHIPDFDVSALTKSSAEVVLMNENSWIALSIKNSATIPAELNDNI